MQIIIIGNESQKNELAVPLDEEKHTISWFNSLSDVKDGKNADAVIDLLFEEESGHLETLKRLETMVIVNSVVATLSDTHPEFVRINGWNGFLEKNILEAAGPISRRQTAEEVMAVFGRSLEWLPDLPGFVSPRVISMIINEAFLALGEGVSTREQINTAMKLGTNYPYGPFEWAEKIGVERVKSLLTALSQSNPRYTPAANME